MVFAITRVLRLFGYMLLVIFMKYSVDGSAAFASPLTVNETVRGRDDIIIQPLQETISKRCLSKLQTAPANRSFGGRNGAADDLFRAFEECNEGFQKFCKYRQTAGRGQYTNHRTVGLIMTDEEYGCFPRICSEDDVANYLGTVRKGLYSILEDDGEVHAHCAQRHRTDAGFWVTIVENERNEVGKVIPQITVTRPSNSLRSDFPAAATPNIAGQANPKISNPSPLLPTSAGDSSDSSQYNSSTRVIVHRMRSDSSSPIFFYERRGNNNQVPPEGSLPRSYSELSLSLRSTNDTLNFSNPSIFVSPLQTSSHSSKEGVISVSDSETYSDRNIVIAKHTFADKYTAPVLTKCNIVVEILMRSSVFRTARKLLAEYSDIDCQVSHMYAVQTIAMWWLMLNQTVVSIATSPVVENPEDFLDHVSTRWFQLIVNSDPHWLTIFFTSAAIDSAHTSLIVREVSDRPPRIMMTLLKLAGRKLHQQLPFFFCIVLLWTFVIPACVNGLLWFSAPHGDCRSLWWTDVLCISNFYPTSALAQCMPWAWFVVCDMQMYLFGILLVYLMSEHPRLVTVAIVGTMGAMKLIAFYIAYDQKVLGSPIAQFYLQNGMNSSTNSGENIQSNFGDVFDVLLNKPYYNWIPYAAGILVYVSSKNFLVSRKSYEVALTTMAFACAACLALLLVASGLISVGSNGVRYGPAVVNLLQIFWILLLIPIVITIKSCRIQGIIQRFLSCRFWITLGKMNFYCLLTSPMLLFCFLSSADSPIRYSPSSVMLYHLALILATYIAVILLHLFVQGPIRSLLWGGSMVLSTRFRPVSSPLTMGDDCDRCEATVGKKARKSSSSQRFYTYSSSHKRLRRSMSSASRCRSLESVFSPVLRTKYTPRL